MKNKIIFPLAGPKACCESELKNGAKFYCCFSQPTIKHSLMQIPEGPQPRSVDSTAKIPKDIYNSYLNNDKFAIMCRGMRIVIDDGSFEQFVEHGQHYGSFTCNQDLAGQYDGGHCQEKITQAIKNLSEEGDFKAVPLHLTEYSAFEDGDDVRSVAKASNAVQPQKYKSELNIAGGFDILKKNVNYCPVENIGFKQNQLSCTGEKVKEACHVGVVTNLLATMLPCSFTSGAMLGDISGYPKKGEDTVVKKWQNHSTGPLLRAASEHVDTVLEFHDFVQSTMADVLHGNHENYAILRKTMNGHINKPKLDRPMYPSPVFIDATSKSHTLTKDMLPVVCYSIFINVFEYDPDQGKFETDYTIGELKAMWMATGQAVLDIIEARFTTDFETVFNNRWGDFASDDALWALCAKKASKVINNKKLWRPYVVTSFSEAAAK